MNSPIFPVLDEHIYVEAIWYVAYDDADMLAMVWRQPATGPWRARYRFRHYKDDKAWDNKDTKNVYDITPPADWPNARERLVNGMDTCILMGVAAVGPPLNRRKILVQGDGVKAGELLLKEPFAHPKSAGAFRINQKPH
jgi:hypothetical protein